MSLTRSSSSRRTLIDVAGLPALLVAIFAGATGWFFLRYVPHERAAAIDLHRQDLAVRADVRREAVRRYFTDTFADAATLASYDVTLRALAPDSADRESPRALEESRREPLEDIFTVYSRNHGILGVVLWDKAERPVAKSRDFIVEDACSVAAREVFATGAPAAGFHTHSGSGPVLTFAAPVRSPNGRTLGAVVATIDPREWLYPLLIPFTGSTGEAVLIARAGADMVYLSPLRFRPDAPLTFRRPFDTPAFAARAALEGDESVGPYVDYRGVRVLSGGRRLPPSPWALVVKMDEKEALAGFREKVRRGFFEVAALLIAVLGIAWGLWLRRGRLAQAELTRIETRHRTLFEEANDVILYVARDGKILDANRAAEELYGRPREELVGVDVADLHTDTARSATAADLEASARSGRLVYETEHRRADGSPVPVEVSTRLVDSGAEPALLSIIRDISWRKRADARIRQLNRLLRTISEVNQAIVRADDRTRLLDETCRILVEQGGFRMAWVGLADPATGRVVPGARAGEGLDYLDGIEIRLEDVPEGRGPTGTAIRTGRHVVAPDLATDSAVAPWREQMLAHGFRSSAAFPFRVHGEVAGALTIFAAEPLTIGDEEISLLDELADDLGYALQALEDRDERRRIADELRRSGEAYRRLFEANPHSMWVVDRETLRFLAANDTAVASYGYSREEFLSMTIADVRPPEDRERALASARSGQRGLRSVGVWRHLRKDGSRIEAEVSMQDLDWEGRPARVVLALDVTERERAEEQLRKASAYTRSLIEASLDPLVTISPEGKITDVNAATEAVTGRPRADLVGSDFSDYFTEPERAREGYRKVLADSRVRDYPLTIRHVSGRTTDVLYNASVYRDEAGQVQGVFAAARDITEKTRAENERWRLEERFRRALDEMLEGCMILGFDWKYLYVNEEAARHGHEKRENLLDRTMLECYPGVEKSEIFAHYRRCMEERVPERFESAFTFPDGSTDWFEMSVEPAPEGIFVLSLDISDRKRAEQAKEQYLRFFRLSLDPMAIADPFGCFTAVNPAFLQLTGYSESELLSNPFLDFVFPEDRERTASEMKLQVSTRPSLSFENRYLCKDGRVVLLSWTAFFDKHDGATYATARDITEIRRGEEALRRSEEKYRLFFEQNLAGHFISTPDGRMLACNPAFAQIFGFSSPEEARKRSIGTLYPSPEMRKKFLDRLRAEKRLERIELELRRADGQTVHVVENVIGVFDDEGKLIEIRGYLIDETERRAAEREFRQAQKMEAVGRLAGGVAHDFNNALTVILGYLEILQPSLAESDPRLAQLEEIRKAAERAASLTRQLLAFSRKQVLQPAVLDLNAVVRDVAKMLSRLIGEDIQLRTALAPGLGAVLADPGQIEQVLMNLAVNARDAMPKGGTLVIETADLDVDRVGAEFGQVASPGRYVMLAVTDAGCGMNATTMAHLFEPFFTTKEKGKGTGLGLATVYGIVKQSGGFIRVESELDRGSAFRVFLPRAAEERPRAAGPTMAGPLPTGWETILLAEDDAALRAMACKMLTEAGYTVLAASGADEALGLAASHPTAIDLLLTDVIMPGLSGPELARRLGERRPGVAVLYMSGYTDELVGLHGVLEPSIHFIQKPFTRSGLLLKVRETLAAKKQLSI